jgi:Cu-Zn family superoxide dismutase
MVKAVSVIRGDSKVSGTVTFEQESEGAPTKITYDISGNDANAKRGFHIHTFGDNTNGCTSAGPHFNPHGKNHGNRTDDVRHVGDLGNLETDSQGNAKGTITDSLVKLIGPESVVGVSFLGTRNRSKTLTGCSAPSLCTPAPTTSARAATRSPSRLATPVPDPPAVSLVSLLREAS